MGDFIDREKLNAVFDEHVKQANEIFGDTEQMSRVLDETDRVLFSEPILKDACPDISDLNGMVRSYVSGQYTEVSPKSICAILGAFMYLNKSSDEIADNIPVIGYLDDLVMLSNAIEVAKEDLELYRSSVS